jgi:hypothetical protein
MINGKLFIPVGSSEPKMIVNVEVGNPAEGADKATLEQESCSIRRFFRVVHC